MFAFTGERCLCDCADALVEGLLRPALDLLLRELHCVLHTASYMTLPPTRTSAVLQGPVYERLLPVLGYLTARCLRSLPWNAPPPLVTAMVCLFLIFKSPVVTLHT